jgi:hypothetical protein
MGLSIHLKLCASDTCQDQGIRSFMGWERNEVN